MAVGSRFPRETARRLRAISACVLVALCLTGCFEMDAALSIAADSKVRLSAEYSVSALVYPLLSDSGGIFDAKPPLDRKALDSLVSGVPGAKVASYSETVTSMKRGISVVLDFPNPDSFCSFLAATAVGASFSNTNGRRVLSVTIPCPAARADEELLSSLDVLFGDYGLKLKISLPSAALSAPAGKAEGKTASFEMRLVDLVKSGKNAIWAVSW